MDIIEQLKHHENNQLDDWLDYSDKITKKFLKDIVTFAKENESLLKQYCVNTIPTEFSSLSIIYEALSEYSTRFNEFLYEDIKRVINLAKQNKINPEFLEVLTDIESEDIYSKDEEVYIKILNHMISNLHTNNEDKFNIELLDIIDWFLIELDEDDEISESKEWINQLAVIANDGSSSVKLKAREVLKNLDASVSLNPLSFMERLKGIFK